MHQTFLCFILIFPLRIIHYIVLTYEMKLWHNILQHVTKCEKFNGRWVNTFIRHCIDDDQTISGSVDFKLGEEWQWREEELWKLMMHFTRHMSQIFWVLGMKKLLFYAIHNFKIQYGCFVHEECWRLSTVSVQKQNFNKYFWSII